MSVKILVEVIFVLILLLTTICSAEASENKFVLQRIKAEEGDGSDIKVMLRTGRFAKGEIYDMSLKNVKGDFFQEAPREMIIVSNGFASVITKDQESLVIGKEFLVDNSLNMAMKGNWNGKKNGAVHMLMGKITIFDYEFDSNSNYPLVFKITGDGYEYLGGVGRVKDLQTGEIYVLVAQEKAINENEYEGEFFDRHACERECCELLLRGQIKEGVTIKECVKALCK
jgi:hypothetical protein